LAASDPDREEAQGNENGRNISTIPERTKYNYGIVVKTDVMEEVKKKVNLL